MSEYSTDVVDAVVASSDHRLGSAQDLQRAFSIILFAVFVIVDLLALMAGAQSFGSINAMQSSNDKVVMTIGPIASNVRASDTAGGVTTGTGPEGEALVLVERDAEGTYETRIYLYQGHIVQEYSLGNAPYAPERATVLAESKTFSFAYDEGLLTIESDAGVSKIALRNEQGGV